MMLRQFVVSTVLLPVAVAGAQVATTNPADSLHPISLQEAVSMAQRNAPAAVQARGQIRTTSSSVRSAYGAFLPSVSASFTQTMQGGERFDQLRGPVPQNGLPWSSGNGVSASLELFDGFRRLNDLKARRADVDAAEANEVSQRFNIALQV